ncbi:hypothetical protein EYY60_02595 [Flavobacterium zhairuonense]|uniref:hypothetical protein n=1 Tax=Flavobacterium zhairuonense TaxID=2493631 RepID=UPI00104F5C83|nr:hypothetical protein [Flavobacterium zhairuonense]KAF2515393.1 hypothetical protein EYY60_02595 [Flavobacterium zhairuonense]
MDRIIILFRLAVAIFLFYILNYLLYSTFNQIPVFISAPINGILVIGAFYYVYKGRKQFIIDNESDEDMPLHLEKSSYFFILVGAFIAFFLVSSSFRTTLYIDNGKSTPVEIKIASETAQTIAPNSFIVTEVPIGKNELIIDGKTKTINILGKGEWVYNVDNLNSYIEGTVDYAEQEVRRINNTKDTTTTKLSADKIIHKEFFKLESDFIFEAPETISISKNAQTGEIHTQTVLYRLPKELSQIK